MEDPLSVSDDGIGMSEEIRRRAFDPFFTTKMGRGGTGLGLNIVYNIVHEVLGGSIEIDSHPGGGTRITVELPQNAPSPRETTRTSFNLRDAA